MDHCSDYKMLELCVKHGYTSLMIDASMMKYEDNIQLTRKVVKLGHDAGACIESELGRIGGVEDELTADEREATLTVPHEAAEFAALTGIDTLAVAIGTAHGLFKGEPNLDYGRLQQIADLLDIPLVLHGASGVPYESVRKAIALGICKVNIATELKIPFADAIKEIFLLNPDENDPRVYMGAGRKAAQSMVEHKIKMCGSDHRI
jgi:tagatose 1,6-diphosphate aldolase GatY/KbaY